MTLSRVPGRLCARVDGDDTTLSPVDFWCEGFERGGNHRKWLGFTRWIRSMDVDD